MIEERVAALRDRDGLVDAGTVRIPSLQHVGPVIFQENIFAIIDVALRLAVGDLLNAPPETIIAIGARGEGRGIPGGEVFHLGQPVFRIVGVLAVVAGGEQRLPREIPVVVVLIAMRRIRRQLIAGVHHAATGRPVPHRIVGKRLRGSQQWVTGRRQPIERIVPEALRASSVRQTRPIPHRVVGIGGLVDLRRGGRELVEDLGDLTGGIIS